MKSIEIILLVIAPLSYALWNGRNGIKHPAKDQVIIVGIIMLVSSFWIGVAEMSWLMIVKGICVSYAGYLLFFPPLMNFVRVIRWNKGLESHIWVNGEIKKTIVYCLDHLSDTAIPDKWRFYRAIPWQIRIAGYLVVFVISIIWFVWNG